MTDAPYISYMAGDDEELVRVDLRELTTEQLQALDADAGAYGDEAQSTAIGEILRSRGV